MELLTWERPALQSLVSLMDRVPDLQHPVDADVLLPKRLGVELILVHITTCYYTMMLPGGVEAG